MPAYFDTGFVVREPAWHGLAPVLDDYIDNWPDARKAAGLDWDPVAAPAYARNDTPTGAARIRVSARQREIFVREFVPSPPTDAVVSDRVLANIETARAQVRAVLASPTTADTAHTAYGLVQAGIEYLDHVRTFRDAESRFNRTYLRAEPLKRRVEALAREAATV